ncbi:MAG: putative lipid II flippase FtsW [Clostridiales bacterium]|nr:cell division protein FtsW [Clostridiales bacterium]MBR6254419.1 cell division protein FtsW [Clostridiales bacterium]MCR5274313.1 putative lipid II flippase FtsW [Clostridiales bacterium]
MKRKMKGLVSENIAYRDDGRIESMDVLAPGRVNLGIVIIVLIMMAFGMVMLFSASMPKAYTSQGNSLYYVIHQGAFLLLGFVAALVITFLPLKVFDKWPVTLLVYLSAVGMALLTLTMGKVVNGARRWIFIGGLSIQPSEYIKVAIVFSIAGYRSFVQRVRKKGGLKAARISQKNLDALVDITIPAILIMFCLLIVVLQPHMSCFLILSAISVICFLCCGIPLSSWIRGCAFLLGIMILVGGIFYLSMPGAQKKKLEKNFAHVATRLNIFRSMNTEEEEEKTADEDDTYQIEQSIIAIGSGGMTGVGFGNSRQKYMYLPEAHNDYVYSIICEELGFVGGLTVMLLFWAFALVGFLVSWQASSLFTRVLTTGYTSLLTLQAFLNIGVATGAIPPTGITLPFFSYGGTANFFFMIAVGMILSVSRSGRKRKTVKLVV